MRVAEEATADETNNKDVQQKSKIDNEFDLDTYDDDEDMADVFLNNSEEKMDMTTR